MSSNIVQIDGDYLLHCYASIAQHMWYNVRYADGGLAQRFESWEDVRLHGYHKANNVVIEKDLEIKNFSLASEGFDNVMEEILKACGTSNFNLFLSGEGNFRYDIGTLKPYKWNRDEAMCGIYGRQYQPKPYYYQQLKDYVMETNDVTTVDGMEADDAMVMAHLENQQFSIIASVDKDFNQVHGRHFDIGSKWVKRTISKKEAKFFLYSQILTGDSVDGIPGIFRMGEAKASKVLAGATCEKELFYRCVEEWIKYAKKLGGTEEDGKGMMIETAQLVYLLRSTDIEKELSRWEPMMKKYERTKRNEKKTTN